MRQMRRICLLLSALSISLSVYAQSSLSVHLSGDVSASGKYLNVKAQLGPGVTRAIRIYSEPSHTLLGVFVSNSLDDAIQNDWRSKNIVPRTRLMEFPFNEGATATLQMSRPSAGDKQLSVHLFGRWPGSEADEDRSFLITTNPEKFAFTYTFDETLSGALCCGDGLDGCVKACTRCPNEVYVCSTLPEYNEACGGSCKKNEAKCEGGCNC